MKIFAFLAVNYDDSLSAQLFEKYVESKTAQGHEVRIMKINKMDFNPILEHGYKTIQTLEPDLVTFQENLKWSDHSAIFYHIWWGEAPAKFKGLIERVILPGFAFNFKKGGMMETLLNGRTMRVFATMNAPTFFSPFLPDKKFMKYVFKMGAGIKLKFSYFGKSEQLTADGIAKVISKVQNTL